MIGSPRFNEGSTMSSEPETPSVCLLHHSSAWLSYSRLPHGPRWQLESSHYTPAVGQNKEESRRGKKGLFPAGSAPFKQPSQMSQITFLFNFHWPEHTYSQLPGRLGNAVLLNIVYGCFWLGNKQLCNTMVLQHRPNPITYASSSQEVPQP